MNRPLGIPMLHLRGDADPYVLADPVDRTQRYAPHGRFVSSPAQGISPTKRHPTLVNDQLMRFLTQVYG